jgi:hypothetical protein
MMVASNFQLEELVEQVKSWPAETRIILARRVLETLEEPPRKPARMRPTVDEFRGMLRTDGMAPTDEECEAILVEELTRKYSP